MPSRSFQILIDHFFQNSIPIRRVTRKLSEATYDPADGNTILEKMIYQYLE